MGMIQTHRL